jgi:hypothetical protein
MGILEKVVGFIKEKIQASIRERAIKKAKKKLKKLIIKACCTALLTGAAALAWKHRKLILGALIKKKLPVVGKCPLKCFAGKKQ